MQKQYGKLASLGLALIVAILTCVTRAQEVKTNYLPGTDFSKFRTYKWVNVGDNGAPDQILDAQIKQSIDAQMAAKGFTKTDAEKADLLIRYQVAVSKEKEWNGYATGFGYPYGPWGMDSARGTATSTTIHVGTLVLDIYDPAERKLVWTGTASKSIDGSKDPEKIQKNLNKAMEKLMKNFPPGRK